MNLANMNKKDLLSAAQKLKDEIKKLKNVDDKQKLELNDLTLRSYAVIPDHVEGILVEIAFDLESGAAQVVSQERLPLHMADLKMEQLQAEIITGLK